MPCRAGIPVVRVRRLRAPSLACEPQLRLILAAAVVTPAGAQQRFVAACHGEHVAQLGATGCGTERYAAALVGTQAQRGGTPACPIPLTPERPRLCPPVPTYARPFPLTGGSGLVLVPVQIVRLNIALAWPVIAHDCRHELKRRVDRRIVDAPEDPQGKRAAAY